MPNNNSLTAQIAAALGDRALARRQADAAAVTNTDRIRAHSFDRHRKAVAAIEGAIAGLDRELRDLHRQQDLYPGEKAQRERQARARAEQQVREARAELAEAIAESKALAVYAPPAGNVPQRAYYQQQAGAELAGMRPDQVIATVRQVAGSGDHERAQEYVRAARGPLANTEHEGVLRGLERQVEPRDAKLHRSWEAALQHVEASVGWLDQWTAELLPAAGRVSQRVKDGEEAESPLDTRKVSLWLPRVEGEAAQVLARKVAEQDGVEPPGWAAQRHVFGDGQAAGEGEPVAEGGDIW